MSADATDEYIKIDKSTVIESLKRFCCAVIEIFVEQYLRSPSVNDIERRLHVNKQRGFPGMLGSLDCMHWKWKNCPTTWAGQYGGHSGSPTIILKVVADYDLWIWHTYFGLPGLNKDINVLKRSHLFVNLTQCIAPPTQYVIQGRQYNMGYYLADINQIANIRKHKFIALDISVKNYLSSVLDVDFTLFQKRQYRERVSKSTRNS
ncbi:uncharacterized protein LOC111411266 [Olea europaea var. sylvestris]|uniref:uncharacterized protein LOC111411266 n=1 Tax=Olea europaea var. sylvestris TaxID=158386 RepID=UPI000C1D7C58|nr:uncharacterized protein LOC111411266 [Olea europaea var. sylvestris]